MLYIVYCYIGDSFERHFMFIKPAFNIQEWANSRQQAFKYLDIRKIEYEEMPIIHV